MVFAGNLGLSTALVLVLSLYHADGKGDPNTPHPHRGVIKPFKPGKPDFTLKRSEIAELDEGKLLMYQVQESGNSGRATAIQNVHAPPKLIWKQLLDFNSYARKVDKLAECGNYEVKNIGLDGSKQLKTRFLVKAAPGFSYEYYCDHLYSPIKKSLTWSLDYDRTSDFDDVQGKWYVAPHPTRENWSQVFYSADLKMKLRVPKLILNILTTTALKSAVSWVKRESEADWAKQSKSSGGLPKLSFGGFGRKTEPEPLPVPVESSAGFPAKYKVAIAATAAAAVTGAAVVTAVRFSDSKDSKSK